MSKQESENLNILLKTAELKLGSTISNFRALDTKASIFFAFLGVLFIPSLNIFQWTIRKDEFIFLKFLPGILIIIGIIFCLLSLFPQKWMVFPNLIGVEKLYSNGISPNHLKAELFSVYREALLYNFKISKQKLKFTKYALYLLIASFLVIILLFIFKGVLND